MMRTVSLLACLGLIACQSRPPVTTLTADGSDIACIASDFDRLTAHADGPHLEPYGEGEQHAMETDPTYYQHNAGWFHVVLGLYSEESRTCYVVAFDPAHLSPSEHLALVHEHAHRVQHLHGWAAAAPIWASLPPRYLTHPEINARLRAEGWIK